MASSLNVEDLSLTEKDEKTDGNSTKNSTKSNNEY